MANGLIFPYHVVSATTEGATGKARGAPATVVRG
jgi:hypothetical protein